jgi:hypothetical protein
MLPVEHRAATLARKSSGANQNSHGGVVRTTEGDNAIPKPLEGDVPDR